MLSKNCIALWKPNYSIFYERKPANIGNDLIIVTLKFGFKILNIDFELKSLTQDKYEFIKILVKKTHDISSDVFIQWVPENYGMGKWAFSWL